MNNIFLKEFDYICKISIKDEGFFNNLKAINFWDVYCPDVTKIEEVDSKEVNMEIIIDDEFSNLSFTSNLIKIPQNNLSVEDVITVVDYLYEAERNRRGIYTLNSSSVVYRQNKGIIFFGGATGMGKTTLARYFAQKEDFEMFSDDKTLIDVRNLKIIGGSKYIHINKTNLEDEFKVDENKHVQFEKDMKDDFDASLFVYGHIEDSKSFHEYEIWNEFKFEWHLYEALTKRIRGTSRRIISGRIALPSMDTEELSRKRIEDVNYLCSNRKCLFLKANVDYIYQIASGVIK